MNATASVLGILIKTGSTEVWLVSLVKLISPLVAKFFHG